MTETEQVPPLVRINQDKHMKKAINKGFAVHLYLDFVKNHLTIEQMAADRNINPYALTKLLEHGKQLNDINAKQIKYQKAWFEYLAK